MDRHRHKSFCRVCNNLCAVIVETEDIEIRRIIGDPDNPVYQGYTCIKGRSHKRFYGHPDRLLHPLERLPGGGHPRMSALPVRVERVESRDREPHLGAVVDT